MLTLAESSQTQMKLASSNLAGSGLQPDWRPVDEGSVDIGLISSWSRCLG